MNNLIALDTALDPWLKNPDNRHPVPKDVDICLHELHLGIDRVQQLLALRRTETHDELWSECLDEGRVTTVK